MSGWDVFELDVSFEVLVDGLGVFIWGSGLEVSNSSGDIDVVPSQVLLLLVWSGQRDSDSGLAVDTYEEAMEC